MQNDARLGLLVGVGVVLTVAVVFFRKEPPPSPTATAAVVTASSETVVETPIPPVPVAATPPPLSPPPVSVTPGRTVSRVVPAKVSEASAETPAGSGVSAASEGVGSPETWLVP